MHLKMKISMGGPTISVDHGAELAFDEEFPFTANEVHRFCAADIAELVGTDEEVAAWLEANPFVEPTDAPADELSGADEEQPAADDGSAAAADEAKAAADAAKAEVQPAKSTETKPAAAKPAAKKG